MSSLLWNIVVSTMLLQGGSQSYIAEGPAMQPNIYAEDRLTVVTATEKDIERGDIIVFQSPENEKIFVKRVVGLPGEKIKIKGDQLYINNKVIKEPYIQAAIKKAKAEGHVYNITDYNGGNKKIPQHHFFVLGDNRSNSMDSRMFGTISIQKVKGEVTAIQGKKLNSVY